MKYFYSKEKCSKLIGSIAFNDEDIKKYLNSNIFVDCPNLNNDNTVVSEVLFNKPTWTGIELREMTREEVCEGGDLSVLFDGEIYENGVIKTIERPQGVKIEWQYPQWVEIATLEEQLEYYKQQILNTTRELLIYKESGFANVELENKLKELTEKHNNIAYDIAMQENKMLNL